MDLISNFSFRTFLIFNLAFASLHLFSVAEPNPSPRFEEKQNINDYEEFYLFGVTEDSRRDFHPSLKFASVANENEEKELLNEPKLDSTGVSSTTTEVVSNQFILTSAPDLTSVIYIGCFDAWKNVPLGRIIWKYDDTFTHTECSNYCIEISPKGHNQLSYLKGAQCACGPIEDAQLLRVPDLYCNSPCSVSAPVEKPINETCGGNYVYSVYCSPGTSSCTPVLRQPEPTDIYNPSFDNQVSNLEPLVPCAVIPEDGYDKIHYTQIHPTYDYFPLNSPIVCVQFCQRPVSYIRGGVEVIRNAAKYSALLPKWPSQPNDFIMNMSICVCIDDISYLNPVSDDICNYPCPGDNTTFCGGPSYMHVSIYCADCNSGDGSTTNETPTDNNCARLGNSSSLSDCEGTSEFTTELESTTTEITSTTTITSMTVTSTDVSSTTEKHQSTGVDDTTQPSTELTTSITVDPTTTVETTVIAETTTIAATTKPPVTNPPDYSNCELKNCSKIDRGKPWNVCATTIGRMSCKSINEKIENFAEWECLKDGKFATPHPNYEQCSTEWVHIMEERVDKIVHFEDANMFLVDMDKLCKKAQDAIEFQTVYFGHEIENIADLTMNAVTKGKNLTKSSDEFEKIAILVARISDTLLTFQDPWMELNATLRSKFSTKLIKNQEETMFDLTSLLDPYEEHNVRMEESNSFLVAGFVLLKSSDVMNDTLEFPAQKADSFLRLPAGWKNLVSAEKIDTVGMILKSSIVNTIMPGQFQYLGKPPGGNLNEAYKTSPNKLINGKLISFTVGAEGKSIHFEGKGVEITFHHDVEAWGDTAKHIKRKLHIGEEPKAVLGSATCVYWDTTNLVWSSAGCKLISADRYETKCECSHLTSFAILMDVHQYVGKDVGLEILTLILCPFSMICLFVSVIVFSIVRVVHSPRTTITKNLSICLLIGNTLVLLVLDRHYFNMNEDVCIAAGILTHYIFLCAFTWMAVEGIHLYRMVVHVFDSGYNYTKIYSVLAYGIPILIVAFTVVVGYLSGDRPYGSDMICWLEGSYIWSFMVPVALIVMGNFIVLFITLKTAYQLQNTTNAMQGRVKNFKSWIRGCISITVLLGLTWMIGFFIMTDSPYAILSAYMFTILNASQGVFLFVFHCLLNDKVRAVAERRLPLPSWLSSSGSTDRSVSFIGKKPGVNIGSFNSEAYRRDRVSKSPMRTSCKSDNCNLETGFPKVNRRGSFTRRRDSVGTVSSMESHRVSESGNTTDGSQKSLVEEKRSFRK